MKNDAENIELTVEELLAMIDKQSRERLGISGEKFINDYRHKALFCGKDKCHCDVFDIGMLVDMLGDE